ncbi:hypothetical protein [Streptomyces olivochromogenes]|uniref:hypothetical protein n=1 Tax=Streptomyces olivochromogenes TaxID=1963 RepID=UPI001F26E96E|nr:hypothetical protein [Streptomyces olivochromogenes]MCF3135253.1 hypothetical protein [Streptomyces olivochromogenes]
MSGTTTAARRPVNAEQAGRRIEEVLDRLAAAGDPAVAEAAEELVRCLMDFYGAGLARVLELLPPDGPGAALLGDELVAGLLVLHELHPEDRATRIGRALASVRDQNLKVEEFDEPSGTLRLRAAGGSGCGCAATADAMRQAAEDALTCFVPEVTAVEVRAGAKEPALLQIGTRPGAGG